MRIRAPYFVMLAAAASLLPALAAAGAWLPARGEYYNELRAIRSFSDTYYDAMADRFTLPLSQRVESRALDLYSEFGWKSRVSAVIAAPIRSVTSNFPGLGFERTETGLGDLDLGFRVKLHEGPTALAFQVDLNAPLGAQSRTFPTLGSDKASAREHVLFGTGIRRWNTIVEAGVGFESFFAGRRSNAGGSASVGVWLGSSLLVRGSYDGIWQLGTLDWVTFDKADKATFMQMQTVGPELRYRVDDRCDVFAGSRHVAAGRRVLHDDAYYFGMAFRQSKRDRLQGLLGNKSRP